MKTLIACCAVSLLLLTGCQSGPSEVTNQRQPGPAVGRAVGTAVGTVSGQVVGGTVAAVEATGQTIASAFNVNETRVIRKWETVTTPDGRTVQRAKDYIVDAEGNIIGEVKK